MIFYLILLMLAYVTVWVPLINSLSGQISKAKLMLLFVPIEILVKMKSIAKVLNSSELLQPEPAVVATKGSKSSIRER